MRFTPGLDTQLGSDYPAPEGAAGAIGSPVTLSDTATLQEKTVANDSLGTVTETWTDAGTALCKLLPKPTIKEVVQQGALKAVTVWKCYFELGTNLAPQRRAQINGYQFEIIDSDVGLSDATVITAQLVRVGS